MAFETFESAQEFYTFKEISSVTGVKPYVLRFWESEFEEISPTLLGDGSKQYRQSDLDFILLVKSLLFEQKMSIPEAKLHVSKNGNEEDLAVVEIDGEEAIELASLSEEETSSVAVLTPSVDRSTAKSADDENNLELSLNLLLGRIEDISKKYSWNI